MDYLIHILILISIFGILGLSLNLVVGYTGLLSATHAGFYGIGAYAVVLFMKNLGMNFFIALPLSIIITMIAALIIGIVLSKFKDDIYTLGSFGFAIITYGLMLNLQEVTRGPLGIPGISRPDIFGFTFSSNFNFLILSIAFLLLVYGIVQYITRSSYGRVLRSIRENEKTIKFFGYKTYWYKLSIFMISAGLAAIAGGLFATYVTFVDPSSFTLIESIFLISMIILGGLANNKGALLGVIIMILLPELLRFVGFPTEIAAQMRQVIYGLMLVLMMMYRPQGILGKFKI